MKRRWMFAGLLVAVVVARVAVRGSRVPEWQKAGQLSETLASDPATAGMEAEVRSTYQRLLSVSAAPDLVAANQEDWLERRLRPRPGDPDAPPDAQRRAGDLRRQIAAWRQAASLRPDAAALETDCVYAVDYAPCQVQQFGTVEGSAGALRFQRVGRYLADTAEAVALGLEDGMVGTMLQVFAPDGDDSWHMVLATQVRGLDVAPTVTATPSGAVLHWSEDGSTSLFTEQGGRWRPLRQGGWKREVAARAPAGTCLDRAWYAGVWPQASVVIPELSRMVPSLPGLTYDAVYSSGKEVVGRAKVSLAVVDGALTVSGFDLQRVSATPLLARLYHRCS